MPDIPTPVTRPAGLPAGLAPDPLDQASRRIRVPSGVFRPDDDDRIVWLVEAKAIREQAVREATARIMVELEKVSAQLVEANEALEAWGAFDYMLLARAEIAGIQTAELSPIQVVTRLIDDAVEADSEWSD